MIKKFLLPLFLCLVFSISAISQPISSPEDVFGFKMGADKKLVNWEQIVSYFQQLDRESPRVKVIELGKTTLDHPMIMAIISSKDVVANLDKYRQIQEQLANPYDLSDRRAQQLINDGKLVVLITMNIHSSEIGASQGALELAYELASSEEKEFASIRENLIVLIIPSLNPDGQDMITKWYLQTVGTPYEGSRMPYKYHHYADHDNNRDWHFFNLKETRLVAKVLYHDWYPEIVMDQHQMGSRGARLFLPPYADPVNPNVAPQLTASVNFIGNYIASTMQQKGYKGIVTGTIFNAFFEGTMSKTPLWHNRIGILTEAASVRYATPLYFPRTSLRGMGIDLPEYSQQTNFVDPWEGGWWRLRDIVNYQKAAALSLLQLSATYKERFKTLFYELNKQAIENPSGEKLQAFILPLRQHDPGNVVELLRRLQMANVKIYQADSDFVFNGKKYQKGDFIIPLNQPSRAYIKDVMERQFYPDLKEYPGGPPRQPYDVTAWTFPLQMGVESVEVNHNLPVSISLVEHPSLVIDTSSISPGWLAVERRHTNSFRLINELIKEKFDIYQLVNWDDGFPPGTFVIWGKANQITLLKEKSLAAEVPLIPIKRDQEYVQLAAKKIQPAKIGVYQPWIPWAYDEGWLRWVFDQFGFEYHVLHNNDLQGKTNLTKDYDVIIFGSLGRDWIVEGKPKNRKEPVLGTPKIKREFQGGIGVRGVQRLKDFMMKGGTILFFGEACNFAIEDFHLPARNVLKSLSRKEFFIPGSILEVMLKEDHPLTYGMQQRTPVYYNNNVVLKLLPYPSVIHEIGMFDTHDVLLSGWAVGEEKLYGNVAMAEIPVGKGKAILYTFRPQHRGQTYGTFKLIFNALFK